MPLLGLTWQVIDVPGHTAGHIAYYCPQVGLASGSAPVLFCGDTLFSAGCGRLFEGSPAQMLHTLAAINALPAATQIACTHEYTLTNLRFLPKPIPAMPPLPSTRRTAGSCAPEACPHCPAAWRKSAALTLFYKP